MGSEWVDITVAGLAALEAAMMIELSMSLLPDPDKPELEQETQVKRRRADYPLPMIFLVFISPLHA